MSNQLERAANSQKETRPHDYPPTSGSTSDRELSGLVKDNAARAGQGDATASHALANYVNDLWYSERLDGIGLRLAHDKNTHVLHDKEGHVSEIIFNAVPKHPVDVKIGTNGEVTVNGADKKQLQKDDTEFVKEFNAERLKNDKTLTEEARKPLTKLENALLDGDGKTFTDAIKDLKGNDKVASEVAERLSKDHGTLEFTRKGDRGHNGKMTVQRHGPAPFKTQIDSSNNSRSSERDQDNISAAGTVWSNYSSVTVDMNHEVLLSQKGLNKNKQITATSLEDQYEAFYANK